MPLVLPTLALTLSLSNPQAIAALQWRAIGPAITGGRIDDIAVDPANRDVIYAGAATGGVWKTVNGGTTWAPIFDGFGTTSIGDIAVAPSNPAVVWVGTGEANNRQSSSWGNGVYKSTDGGQTWTLMGLADTKHIGRIIIDPRNPEIVYVAALGHLWGPNRERGVFKTTDGGRTWTNTKFIDENTGFVDLAMDPRDPNTLYAAAYQRRRTPWGFNGGGPGSGLYKTTNGGRTWMRLEGGLPSGNIGRIGIDIYRKNPNVVYVAYEHKDGGIFRSDDRGRTWRKTSALQPRPLYFSQIRIDPQDDRRIYMLGTSLFVSDDGGRTFRSDGARNVHVDHHAMWIDPDRPSTIWLGNDGGLWWSHDRSVTWTRVNNIPLAQAYGAAFDDEDPYRVYAGLQDNGVWSGPSATRHRVGPLNDDWIQVDGGDGMIVAAPPGDSDTAYVETQDGRVARFDLATGERTSIRPYEPPRNRTADSGDSTQDDAARAPALRFNWTTPIVVSPHNPLTIYLAGNRLWRSLDRGDHWMAISPDLTRQVDRDKLPIMGLMPGDQMLGRNDGVSTYGTATAMAESPARAGLLAVGTDDGLVQLSNDGGAAWENVTPKITGAPESAEVSGILLSHASADRLFVAFDNHRNDDYRPYLFASEDGGKTWRASSAGIPETPVRALREDPVDADLIFAGTERGLYVSFDRGGRWQPLSNGLPDVPVYDIEIQDRAHDLVIATHGRGIYIMNIAPLEQWAPAVASAPAHVFEPGPAVAYNFLEHRDFLAQATYVGGNAPRGAVIYYALAAAAASPVLRVIDASGAVVRELPADGAPGVHRLEWDLRLPPLPMADRPKTAGVESSSPRPAESTLARVPGDYGGGGDPTGGEAGAAPEAPRGPMVLPGVYRVSLVGAGGSASTDLRVVEDPRVRITPTNLQARWTFLKRAYEAQRDEIPVANRALKLRDAAEAAAKAVGARHDASADQQKEADAAAKAARQAQTSLNRVVGQIGSVYRDVSESTTRPTEAQEAQLAEALKELKPALAKVKEIEAKGIGTGISDEDARIPVRSSVAGPRPARRW
jgi:photosystem II stability/assembly factor-like uncharacterized protein